MISLENNIHSDMSHKILLTSTSFQDTPGAHQKLLQEQNFEIKSLRGPLKENELIGLIDKFDGIICGDKKLLYQGRLGKLKVISEYGIEWIRLISQLLKMVLLFVIVLG